MNPARAMGTFIRVWREQWAGLSRAQLALAVSAACAEGKPVAKHVVEAWEGGQPPRTAAELSALLQVMRRHGLVEAELDEFRRVALDACAGSRYPGLFPHDSLAWREDVEEVAAAAYESRYQPHERGSLVDLVVAVEDLRDAVAPPVQPQAPPAQQRRQQAALCRLLAALAQHHAFYSRRVLQAAAAAACADQLHASFGLGGLGGELTVLRQRSVQAHTLAHVRSPEAVVWARRLCDLHERARARGRHAEAAAIFCEVIDAVGELEPGAYPALAAQGLTYMDLLVDPSLLFCKLAWAATAEGLPAQTEQHLARWATLDPLPNRPAETNRALGWLALGQGSHREAEAHFREAIRLTAPRGRPVPDIWAYLEVCERARHEGRPLSYRDYRLSRRTGPADR